MKIQEFSKLQKINIIITDIPFRYRRDRQLAVRICKILNFSFFFGDSGYSYLESCNILHKEYHWKKVNILLLNNNLHINENIKELLFEKQFLINYEDFLKNVELTTHYYLMNLYEKHK